MKKYLFPLLIMSAVLLVVGCGRLANVPGQANPPGSIISILVSPESTSLAISSTQQFTASGVMSGGTVTITPSWEVIGGVGTIDATGLFTATSVGVGTVEARIGEVVGRAAVEVTPKTISGYVYDSARSSYYTDDLVPIPGVSIIIGDKSAITDSNGYFSISEITEYKPYIIAYKDESRVDIIVTDKDSVKIYFHQSGGSRPLAQGSATIEGNIIGAPSSSYWGAFAYYFNEDKLQVGSVDTFTNTYVINNVPGYGVVYLGLQLPISGSSVSGQTFAYNKYDMTPGINNADIVVGDNYINGTINPLPGYKPMYARCYLFKEKRQIHYHFNAQNTLNGIRDYDLSNLPELKSGDSFMLEIITAKEESNPSPIAPINKYIYNASGTVNIDLSSINELLLKDPTPAEGSTVSGLITIAWEAQPLNNVVYWIRLSNIGVPGQYIEAFTSENSIIFPTIIPFQSGSAYSVDVIAISAPSYIKEDLFSLYRNYDIDVMLSSGRRNFIYGDVGVTGRRVIINDSIRNKPSTRYRSLMEQLMWPGMGDN